MFYQKPAKHSLTFVMIILLLAACSTRVTTHGGPVLETKKLVKGFAAAWASHDPDKLLSYYSENVKSYDATAYGMTFDYSTLNNVLHSDYLNGAFDVKIASFLVSGDGRFAATVGTFAEKDGSGKFVPKPYVSFLEVNQDKIVWVYDYYGGSASEALPLQEIPDTANQPALSSQIVPETEAIITEWEKAYNGRDNQAFISFYADETKYTQVIAPEWRVFTKDRLSQDVKTRFSSEKFNSKLNNFFVSADGHYVAVQGTYTDAKVSEIPMAILLKIENGKIIEQYDYLIVAQ
jgi:ketosteroid isomerase-like protein